MTVAGEGSYTIDPTTGAVTFTPEKDFVGTAKGVTVQATATITNANGKTATFMTQYDTKTLLFTIAPEDIGQKVTSIEAGAIESMHNLPVSVVGTKLTNGFNGDKPAIHEVPEFEVVSMVTKQPKTNFRNIRLKKNRLSL